MLHVAVVDAREMLGKSSPMHSTRVLVIVLFKTARGLWEDGTSETASVRPDLSGEGEQQMEN